MPFRAKILIVDDSKVMRSAVRRELGIGFEFAEAGNGLEALEAIKSGFVPDLITLDIEMPKLDGFLTCQRLYSDEFRRFFPHLREGRVPVLFLTARDSLADRRRGFELGAIDFFDKNYEPGALAEAVSRILHPRDRLRGIQVLLVDDSAMIRFVVAKALRDVGVEVIEAVNGLDGFTLLCNRMSSIDLVITDIEMPLMTGPEFCRRIRHEVGLAELPVVFFSGADHEQRLAAFEAGATDCLTKPFIKEEMISRLGVHIEKALLNRRLRQAVQELRGNVQRQSDMLATLSHDMRSPLNGIMGFSDLLAQEPNRPAFESETIEQIKQSSQLLLSLVEDILALSKQESGRAELLLQPVELNQLLQRSVAMFQSLARRKDLQLIFESSQPNAYVSGDAESLVRVFNNLLSNAIKFTPQGGRVSVRLGAGAEGKVNIVVADTGIGIPPEKVRHIFDRYSQASCKGTAGESSTGLGMAIVREFVEAHKGEVAVVSVPRKGTEFSIALPRAEAPTAGAGAGREPEVNPELQHARLQRMVEGARVLVADDNPVNLRLARAVLTKAGCTVFEVTDGKAAVDFMATALMGCDLILMDMYMPGMDGLTATREIRYSGNLIPIVALTGNTDEADRVECLAAGMNDFLTKPFTPKALLEAVSRYRAGAGATALAPTGAETVAA